MHSLNVWSFVTANEKLFRQDNNIVSLSTVMNDLKSLKMRLLIQEV